MRYTIEDLENGLALGAGGADLSIIHTYGIRFGALAAAEDELTQAGDVAINEVIRPVDLLDIERELSPIVGVQ